MKAQILFLNLIVAAPKRVTLASNIFTYDCFADPAAASKSAVQQAQMSIIPREMDIFTRSPE
jgi:hypothetical protein